MGLLWGLQVENRGEVSRAWGRVSALPASCDGMNHHLSNGRGPQRTLLTLTQHLVALLGLFCWAWLRAWSQDSGGSQFLISRVEDTSIIICSLVPKSQAGMSPSLLSFFSNDHAFLVNMLIFSKAVFDFPTVNSALFLRNTIKMEPIWVASHLGVPPLKVTGLWLYFLICSGMILTWLQALAT